MIDDILRHLTEIMFTLSITYRSSQQSDQHARLQATSGMFDLTLRVLVVCHLNCRLTLREVEVHVAASGSQN